MGFYSKHIAPRLIDWSCGGAAVEPQRRRLAPLAEGRVLEVGAGSGLNLPQHDPARVTGLWALEPDPVMRRLADARIAAAPVAPEWVEASAEAMPFEAANFDSVVVTYTLCTVTDMDRTLAGVRRVLRPGGRLLFCEHGAAPDPGVRRWQDRLNGLSRYLGGGCHINRGPDHAIRGPGFALERLESGYLPGQPGFGGFNMLGVARLA